MAGGLGDHQNLLGFKAQEPAAKGIQADGIFRGHDGFGGAELARTVGPFSVMKVVASERQGSGFLTRFRFLFPQEASSILVPYHGALPMRVIMASP